MRCTKDSESQMARHNRRVNLTVRPVTGLAEGARPGPVRPAGYARALACKEMAWRPGGDGPQALRLLVLDCRWPSAQVEVDDGGSEADGQSTS
jgi:hypothetical protein